MPRRLPHWLLLCVVGVLAGSWAFAVLNTAGWIEMFFYSRHDAGVPFRIQYSDKISFADAEWQKAGLAVGDRVLAIQGEPFRGFAQEYGQIRHLHGGDSYAVQVEKPDGKVRDVRAALPPLVPASTPRKISLLVVAILLQIAFPLLCMVLGTWVLVARPQDANAWYVFAILQFMQIVFSRTESFTSALTFLSLWQDWSQIAFLMSALSFGLDFPNPFPTERRYPWARWVLVAPLLLAIPVDTLEIIARLHFVAWFRAVPAQPLVILDRLENAVGIVSISIFCASLFMKLFAEKAPDARRRLRVMVLGSQLGLWPLFLLVIWSAIRGVQLNTAAPFWLFLTALLMFVLFPLSLAYAIIVERAMDVRILLRQGTQYALARGTLFFLRFLGGAFVAFTMFQVLNHRIGPTRSLVQTVVALVLLLGIRLSLEKRARLWIDRKFFRESYAAEQVLSDLILQAGEFTETRPLLETVTKRISETLHIDSLAMLIRTPTGFRLQTSMGVEIPSSFVLRDSAQSITAVERRRGPATVYFDRPDDWLLDASEQERAALRDLHVEVLLPLPGRGRLMGVMALGPKRSEQPYSKSDLQLLASVGTQTGLALENSELLSHLKVEITQRERVNRELEIAHEVQERLFPQSFPKIEGVQVTGMCRPAQSVGGDYYDCMIVANGRLALAIGDVSGKGVSAALLMASLRASLRGQTMRQTTDLATVVSIVNELLYESSASNRYATFFYGEFDPATNKIHYVNAGHNPPVVLRVKSDGSLERHSLEGGGPVVGLVPGAGYEECQLQMTAGDLLLLYTDGISEAMNPSDEEWGEERMIAEAEGLAGISAKQTLDAMFAAADGFAAGAEQHDDMTLMVVKIDGGQSPR
jgi:phosphoserine phosphatase RsbU/P